MTAVCQPCVQTLAAVAIMSEDKNPATPRSMTLMGGPVDTRISPTVVNELAVSHSLDWFKKNMVHTVPIQHAGWRRKVRNNKALEVFLDIFNITNRANFDNPTTTNSDRRIPASFLVLTNLRGGGGFPRQEELGFRFVF